MFRDNLSAFYAKKTYSLITFTPVQSARLLRCLPTDLLPLHNVLQITNVRQTPQQDKPPPAQDRCPRVGGVCRLYFKYHTDLLVTKCIISCFNLC